MDEKPAIWSEWAQTLQRWNLKGAVALLLEAAGPMNILFAQLVHLGQPIMGRPDRQASWQSLAQMLEHPETCRQFAAYLQQENRR
jgi:hypothetical protein